jgi:L-fucose mutarotase/ribose pyranase (RbsD/FucU family)
MTVVPTSEGLNHWTATLKNTLAVFGHRNWVVVADAAYPAQARPGIETIVAAGDHFEIVRAVFDAISASSHLRANIYTDLELGFVAEEDAPGVSECRTQLDSIIGGAVAKTIAHEKIIARLDQCAELFKILIIKTSLTVPYSSVFFELDCGYWSGESEDRLRRAMQTNAVEHEGH